MRVLDTVNPRRQPQRIRPARRTPQYPRSLVSNLDFPLAALTCPNPHTSIFEIPCQWPQSYRKCRGLRRLRRPHLPRSLARIPCRRTMDDRRGNQSGTRLPCICRCQRRRKISRLKTNWLEVSAIRQGRAANNVDKHAAQKIQRDYKYKISSQSKKNFVLEKDVRYLDSRIALLIQNRMALEEVREIHFFRPLAT